MEGLKFAPNLTWLYTEVPFLDRFESAATAGFRAVEFLFPYGYDLKVIRARLKANDLSLVLINTPPGDQEAGDFGLLEFPDESGPSATASMKPWRPLPSWGVRGCTS